MSNSPTKLFPPELRTASVVPRWSIVWTLTRDTVANHSFYVPFYAEGIASSIGWLHQENNKFVVAMGYMALVYFARTHDLPELGMGDIVSPVKAEIVDQERYNQYELSFMQERLEGIYMAQSDFLQVIGDGMSAQMWSIIKAADRLDALLFLIGERRMGNGVIAPRLPDAEARLKSAWYDLPASKGVIEQTWHTVMLPVLKAHREEGGHGV